MFLLENPLRMVIKKPPTYSLYFYYDYCSIFYCKIRILLKYSAPSDSAIEVGWTLVSGIPKFGMRKFISKRLLISSSINDTIVNNKVRQGVGAFHFH